MKTEVEISEALGVIFTKKTGKVKTTPVTRLTKIPAQKNTL